MLDSLIGEPRWRGRRIDKERRAFARVCKEAKVDEVTPHTLKHTCATWALASGMDIWDLAQMLATSVKTLEAMYGHHAPEFQKGVAKTFRKVS